MGTFTRKGLAAVVFTLAIGGSTVLAAVPASAEPGTVTCPLGATVLNYNPPLTNTIQPTTLTASRQLGICVSTARSDITTGTSHFTATFPAACTRPIVGSSLVMTIVWNTGETSTLDLNVVSVTVAGQIVDHWSGSITDGLFEGSTITWDEALVSEGVLLCLTAGLSSNTGTLTTEIISTA